MDARVFAWFSRPFAMVGIKPVLPIEDRVLMPCVCENRVSVTETCDVCQQAWVDGFGEWDDKKSKEVGETFAEIYMQLMRRNNASAFGRLFGRDRMTFSNITMDLRATNLATVTAICNRSTLSWTDPSKEYHKLLDPSVHPRAYHEIVRAAKRRTVASEWEATMADVSHVTYGMIMVGIFASQFRWVRRIFHHT